MKIKIQTGTPTKVKNLVFNILDVFQLIGIPVDNTDRNRTSPFAFTGNRLKHALLLERSRRISRKRVLLKTVLQEHVI